MSWPRLDPDAEAPLADRPAATEGAAAPPLVAIDIALPAAPGGADTAPVLAAVPSAPASEPAPAAPRMLLADDTGVRVLQPGGAPEVQDVVAIDSIAYDTAGEVILTGRGKPDSFVRDLYRQFRGHHRGDRRRWPVAHRPAGCRQGVYTLRVDEVDKAGKVDLAAPKRRSSARTRSRSPPPPPRPRRGRARR